MTRIKDCCFAEFSLCMLYDWRELSNMAFHHPGMSKFFSELRERGVFRAAGLHIAATWLVLQIADVVFPAFDIPDSALRLILFGAVATFPITILVSWFYEVTGHGIRSESEIDEAGEKRADTGYLSTGTIIILVLALGISLYANYEQASAPPVPEKMDVVSVLVSDFKNETGDPIFDNSLESALAIGMEGAPFISAFGRNDAAQVAEKIKGTRALDEETARLVSVREGIKLVLVGQIAPDGSGYEFALRAIDPRDGTVVTDASTTADSKMDVLPAVGRLAIQIREGLGDASLSDSVSDASETFTAASLEAARFYTIAQTYNHREQNREAVEYYEKAVAEDPDFGRAYSGWALSAQKLGRAEQAKELWAKTLTLLDGMTPRERYRTLGVYYTVASRNIDKAIENYELLIGKYPADRIGRSNLAVAYFFSRQFEQALSQGANLVELYPGVVAFRANYALYAMYAGKFDTARKEAEQILVDNSDYYLAYIPLAMAHLAEGQVEAATEVYQGMRALGERAESIALTGLADVALLQGDYRKASAILTEGRELDAAAGNSDAVRLKGIYLAYAKQQMGDAGALRLLTENMDSSEDLSHQWPAAQLYMDLGARDQAEAIRKTLSSQLQPASRAAAAFINGKLAMAAGDYVSAVDALNTSINHADSWLARFELARAYGAAGYHAEALGELEKCQGRLGEVTALFLDDMPTFHYSAPLYYQLGITRQQLGMDKAAADDFRRYLSLRIATDTSPMTEDARAQLALLSP